MTGFYASLILGFVTLLVVISLGLSATNEKEIAYENTKPSPEVLVLPVQKIASTSEQVETKTDKKNSPEEDSDTKTVLPPTPELPIIPPVLPSVPLSSTPPPAPIIAQTFDAINLSARNALVNILCRALPGTSLPSFTGSGVIIDERGVIITNAHEAERLLLKDYKVKDALKCVIRNGSPARDAYYAELMYLPPSWVKKNINSLTTPDPTGTGEDDYAFLRVTGSATDIPLPSSFPYLPTDSSDTGILINAPVLIAAYPAGFLTDTSVQNALYPITALANIKTLYTFVKETLDL